jgi:hypothetical protein
LADFLYSGSGIMRERTLFWDDVVTPLDPQADDLLQYSRTTEPIEVVQARLRKALSALPESIKDLRRPDQYPVEFVGFSV